MTSKRWGQGTVYLRGKTWWIKFFVNGKPVKVQIGLNLTIIGSKEFPEGQEQPAASTAAA